MNIPKFSIGDKVSFRLEIEGNSQIITGTIEIVDMFGAWEIENPREPSYDIMVNDWLGSGEPMFVKHVRESALVEAV